MSWTDILYPENSKMKMELAELSGRMKTNLENCAKAINNLIETIDEHLPGQKFERIAIKPTETVGDNCKIMTERVKEIKVYLEKKEYELKGLLGTELFQQLVNPDLKVQERCAIALKAGKIVTSLAVSVAGIFLVGAILARAVLVDIIAILAVIAASVLALIVVGILGAAVEVLVAFIFGRTEKKNLEKTLTDYKKNIMDFQVACDKFCDDVSIVRAMIMFQMKRRP